MEVNHLDTTLFINHGDRFEPVPLPMEVQLAPAFSVCVGDVDADGNDDLFFSQNFFAVRPEDPRNDAGTGLWLLGQGDGTFRALKPSKSGVRVYGEQRGAALADFDRDGRVDLVVTQNAAATWLFRNQAEAKGVRVSFGGEGEGGASAVGLCGRNQGPVWVVQSITQVWERRKWRWLSRPLGQARRKQESHSSRVRRRCCCPTRRSLEVFGLASLIFVGSPIIFSEMSLPLSNSALRISPPFSSPGDPFPVLPVGLIKPCCCLFPFRGSGSFRRGGNHPYKTIRLTLPRWCARSLQPGRFTVYERSFLVRLPVCKPGFPQAGALAVHVPPSLSFGRWDAT